MIKPGMIGVSNNKKGWLPKLIRYFTRSNLSHTFVYTDDLYGELSIQEANALISVMPFNKAYVQDANMEFWVYDVNAPEEDKKKALRRIYVEFAGTTYGLFQNLWFIYRWFMELFGKDVRKQQNWLADGVVCSELVYWYLWYLGEPYQTILASWNPDTIQPADIRAIAESRPDLFTFICDKPTYLIAS